MIIILILCLVPNVLLCHISCPACKAGTNAFVGYLDSVEWTGMEWWNGMEWNSGMEQYLGNFN